MFSFNFDNLDHCEQEARDLNDPITTKDGSMSVDHPNGDGQILPSSTNPIKEIYLEQMASGSLYSSIQVGQSSLDIVIPRNIGQVDLIPGIYEGIVFMILNKSLLNLCYIQYSFQVD